MDHLIDLLSTSNDDDLLRIFQERFSSSLADAYMRPLGSLTEHQVLTAARKYCRSIRECFGVSFIPRVEADVENGSMLVDLTPETDDDARLIEVLTASRRRRLSTPGNDMKMITQGEPVVRSRNQDES